MADDLERRLQEWGSWAAGVGPVPALQPAHRTRRLTPLLAAAAVVLLVVGAVLLAGRRGAPQTGVPASGQPVAVVVPWAQLPYPAVTSPKGPTVDPRLPRCAAGQLDAVADPEPGAGGGNAFENIHVRLRSGAPTCLLDEQPSTLTGISTNGRRAAFPLSSQINTSFVLDPLVLTAGESSGLLVLQHSTRCDPASTPHDPDLSDVRLKLNTGPLPIKGWTLHLGCLTGVMASSHLGALRTAAAEPLDPTHDLTVTLQLPREVRAGTTLRYTATLTNATPTAVTLAPCPGLVQELAVDKLAGQLNCQAARSVPAGGSEVFAMELAVPPGAKNGTQTLSWHAGSLDARGAVQVTGGMA